MKKNAMIEYMQEEIERYANKNEELHQKLIELEMMLAKLKAPKRRSERVTEKHKSTTGKIVKVDFSRGCVM